ncbi:phosphopyruvate hydratase [Thermodesulfovibrio yellowstonii]|uniref:Enolase n=1 Tax=Thermodesulfovibrio yellowstonii (strain ATCC 51303 / DSM 11347 / YP87) TaxID=289376 RepID=B5YKR8_THEYD|nr:phosphopyruvate hydratase [Thermodesulfovibrio yellowstonii]ACI22044.1 phosphopyruvate hydratase [Thermodesulfovibrio yellowstonii DSM 11347]MDI6864226.1 phosphopyruvate hydratase [Thermodesulfovibrio yellowstonii]
MGEIIDIIAREVLDSRGNPTVQVDIYLDSGVMGRATVPSGASTGTREALELRDGDKKRYFGKGVQKAIDNIINEIAPNIIGMESLDQEGIDRFLIELDGTENKSKLGANAILAVSMAVCKASAEEVGLPLYRYLGGTNAKVLPVPMMNIINGGIHADNNLDIQEFMIVPAGFVKFSQALRAGVEVFHSLKGILKKKRLNTAVGDEGGFSPMLEKNEDAIKLIIDAIKEAGYEPGKDIYIALDPAASEFFAEGFYTVEGKKIDSKDMVDYYEALVDKYPIISIEDGMSEADWEGWELISQRLKNKIQIVADDLVVTNPKIIKEAMKRGIANSILIKLNQIGTVSETLEAIELTKNNKYTAVVSHRSGETEDTIIADLSVSCNTGFIKTGSLSRGERIAKYNRLLQIEEELNDVAQFKGLSAFYNLGF